MSKKNTDPSGIEFGKYAIADEYQYPLEKSPELWWSFKPVTSGMELARSKFLLHNRVVTTPDGVQYDQPPTSLEIAHRELALTYGGSNLTRKSGEPGIPANASTETVESILSAFPYDLVMELWVELARLFPRWGAANPIPRLVEEVEAPEEDEDPNS